MASLHLDSWAALSNAGVPMVVVRGPLLFAGTVYEAGDRFPAVDAAPVNPVRMRQLFEQRKIASDVKMITVNKEVSVAEPVVVPVPVAVPVQNLEEPVLVLANGEEEKDIPVEVAPLKKTKWGRKG